MTRATYGRTVFGTAAVMFGVVGLMWHGSDMWQYLGPIHGAAGRIIAWCLTIAQIAGGIGILFPRTARLGAVVLGLTFVLFALGAVYGIVLAPTTYAQYGNFFEKFCVMSGALGVYAAAATNAARSARLGRIARVGVGLCAISFAISQIVYLQFTASLVPKWIPPGQVFWANATTFAFLLAALAILLNRQARLALRLMALMLAFFSVLVWIPAIVAHPAVLGNWSEFADTFLIAGATWVVAELRSF
jgi:hypothetical protein